MDNNNCMAAIYLDFAEAFDKVPHQRLNHKLRSHGISGSLLTLISSWLHCRQQRVQISGAKSEWITIASGVPQGSVLGPILFLIYINDLGVDVNESTTILKFADDTKIYAVCNNEDDQRVIPSDLSKLEKWQMKFDVKKCKTMHHGHSNSKLQYWLDGNVLNSNSCEKDVRVWISSDLKFTHHVTEAYRKANRMLGMIKRTIVYKNPHILVTLYKSLVRPHLEYCCSAWSLHYQKDRVT